ncbi:putative rhamnosyl transferase [Sinisalibacter aestuarii]|nr:putative rhamnosyl transferase [Sinisalibacter aestuarii]
MAAQGRQPSESTVKGVQVIGLCRFSVPSSGAFQTEHETIEERRAFLYDPRRLDQRFAWFEHVNLPGIEAQKDPAFTYILLLGEDLPEPWRARMEAHAARIPQMVIEYAPPIHHRQACADAMAKHIDPDAEAVIQFRQDDDDGVAVDFVQRLRRDFRKTRGVFKDRGLMALDYNRGINLHEKTGTLTPVPLYHSFLGAGFAVCTRPGDGNYVLDFYHHVIWQQMAAVTFPSAFMWVRGAHDGNDSGKVSENWKIKKDPAELRQILRKRFRIDLPAFKAALRVLDGSGKDVAE